MFCPVASISLEPDTFMLMDEYSVLHEIDFETVLDGSHSFFQRISPLTNRLFEVPSCHVGGQEPETWTNFSAGRTNKCFQTKKLDENAM